MANPVPATQNIHNNYYSNLVIFHYSAIYFLQIEIVLFLAGPALLMIAYLTILICCASELTSPRVPAIEVFTTNGILSLYKNFH